MYRIPKRIIQFYCSPAGRPVQQPLRNRAMMASMTMLNPDYEYLFFDGEQVQAFIDREFPQYRPVFDSFPLSIQRYDFFRYLAVYRYGGFYFDLDVLLASNLSDLLESGCVFPFEGLTFSKYLREQYGMDWEIGNYAFGAAAGHPFLEAVIKNCVRSQQDPKWVETMMRGTPFLSRTEFLVLYTTGPGMVSRTLAENPRLAETINVLFPNDVDVCEPRSWNHFGEHGYHFMQGSWRAPRSYILRKLSLHLEAFQMRGLLKESRSLGATRRHVRRNAAPGAQSFPQNALPGTIATKGE